MPKSNPINPIYLSNQNKIYSITIKVSHLQNYTYKIHTIAEKSAQSTLAIYYH